MAENVPISTLMGRQVRCCGNNRPHKDLSRPGQRSRYCREAKLRTVSRSISAVSPKEEIPASGIGFRYHWSAARYRRRAMWQARCASVHLRRSLRQRSVFGRGNQQIHPGRITSTQPIAADRPNAAKLAACPRRAVWARMSHMRAPGHTTTHSVYWPSNTDSSLPLLWRRLSAVRRSY